MAFTPGSFLRRCLSRLNCSRQLKESARESNPGALNDTLMTEAAALQGKGDYRRQVRLLDQILRKASQRVRTVASGIPESSRIATVVRGRPVAVARGFLVRCERGHA